MIIIDVRHLTFMFFQKKFRATIPPPIPRKNRAYPPGKGMVVLVILWNFMAVLGILSFLSYVIVKCHYCQDNLAFQGICWHLMAFIYVASLLQYMYYNGD